MAKSLKVSPRTAPAQLTSKTPTTNGSTYVNVACTFTLKDAAQLYAEDNGLNTAQDTFRVAATKFLKNAGYIPKN